MTHSPQKAERTRLFLIRHAEAVGPAPEADLTATGHGQALALVPILSALGIDALFASPFRRARATVMPFARQAGMAVEFLDDLRERRLAPAPVPDWRDIVARSFVDRDFALPGGESFNVCRRRAQRAVDIIRASGARRPAAVSHGNLISSVLNAVDPAFDYDAWDTMGNPAIFELLLTGSQVTGFQRHAV